MAYSLVPSTLTATSEGTTINQTVSIAKDLLDPAVSSIDVYKLEHTNGNIVLSVSVGTSSFTLSGQYLQNWNQLITYEEFTNTGNANVTVTQFNDVGSNLNFVFQYIANISPATLTANYAVNINNSGNLFLTQVVSTNFTPNKDSLIAAVARGKI